jgi:hypothetical protein
MKLSSLIWCIVGCRFSSEDICAEKYETKIMRNERPHLLEDFKIELK